MFLLKFIFILLEVLVLFNLLIFVHELGHFLAARWRGLKIDRFAIWFGKPIWKKTINGVEFALGTIRARLVPLAGLAKPVLPVRSNCLDRLARHPRTPGRTEGSAASPPRPVTRPRSRQPVG